MYNMPGLQRSGTSSAAMMNPNAEYMRRGSKNVMMPIGGLQASPFMMAQGASTENSIEADIKNMTRDGDGQQEKMK